ncbi:MAG TPA: BtrH N-terminal domain-containing protein [Smithellaceae bacterium]|nr:BtrH N-terminal domain-containing protein [Smithellaceae bacterium]
MITELTSDGKPFVHYHAAHCESGVTSALFRHKGVDVSEPMVFGIGSGIFFAHLPFMKSLSMPVSTFRAAPGAIFSKTAKRLGADFIVKTYRRNPQKGMDELRQVLRTGEVVGLKTNLYWLPYLSERFRFNFGAHNLIVLREIENGFRISDPSFEYPVDCPAEGLEKARFARGSGEAHGYMYYFKSVNTHPDLRVACIKGMKDSCNMMLKIPLPLFGVRGIRFLAKKVIKSEEKLGTHEACRNLGGIVRWLEEVGTGGSGFRYMYAAFLQEASGLFGSEDLAKSAQDMTAIGDAWRDFSVTSARIIKQRNKPEETFARAGALMLISAGLEENFFKNLDKVVRKLNA